MNSADLHAQLAAELRMQWPPVHRRAPASTAPKHDAAHRGFRQTGEVVEFPAVAVDERIGDGSARL